MSILSNIPDATRANGKWIEHAGVVSAPPRLEQSLLIVGLSDKLGSDVEGNMPYLVRTNAEIIRMFGADSELAKQLLMAKEQRSYLNVYGAVVSDWAALFDNMGDTFITKMTVARAWTLGEAQELATLAQKRFEPEIGRPLNIFLASGRDFEAQLDLAPQINSKFISLLYLEGCPEAELNTLAVMAAVEMAWSDSAQLGLPYSDIAIPQVSFRPERNYTKVEADQLVIAGSSFLRVNNANQLIIGTMATTYRMDELGNKTEGWYFPEAMSNYQYKLFDMEALIDSKYRRVIFVPDNSPTTMPNVVRRASVMQDFRNLINEWVELALTQDAQAVFASLNVEFNKNNPSRLDVSLTDVFTVGGRIFTVRFSHRYSAAKEAE